MLKVVFLFKPSFIAYTLNISQYLILRLLYVICFIWLILSSEKAFSSFSKLLHNDYIWSFNYVWKYYKHILSNWKSLIILILKIHSIYIFIEIIYLQSRWKLKECDNKSLYIIFVFDDIVFNGKRQKNSHFYNVSNYIINVFLNYAN